MILKNSTILITGGTGSFGSAFVPMTLKKYNPKRIVIFSRDEMKQWEMAKLYKNDKRVRFFIGDVRDQARLARALDGIDYVIHAAALKIVPTIEYNPFECIKTNVNGAMNIIDVCIDEKVKKTVALSTDKASSPANLYGATKLVSDRLFTSAFRYSADDSVAFSVVRYGNVMGSRGSIIPFFSSLVNTKKIPITEKRMTRFMITLEQGVELIWKAFEDMKGGEIYVKKIPSMKIVDIAEAISHNAKIELIGVRPGEKIHEQMISAEDSPYTYEYDDYYKILSSLTTPQDIKDRSINGKKVQEGFVYSSDNNKEWMSVDDLRNWIKLNKDSIGKI